ncbi:MAG: cysteine desulfurase NifS [Deltaproteobacteria bacterium]|nr:cysteine desulfurase NifS [Deltaproteobacteria bacterium]
MAVVYLDNNATTQVAPEVFEEMAPYFSSLYGNPSSMHSFGGQVGRTLAQARDRVASLLGCQASEILFTSCGTEGDSTAIRSALEAQPEKRHVVTTKVEHPAVLNLVNHLVKKGYHVTLLSVDGQGRLDPEELRASLRDDTALVSVMYANNETGTVFPLPEIADLVKSRGILLHTDAVQAVGKIPIDLKTLPVDLLVLSGHKLHAPKGVGALFVRKGTAFRPFLIGGHQERGRRGGTENVPGIVALGKACELAAAGLEAENTHVRRLRDRLEQGLLAAIPETRLNGDPAERLPNTVNLSFKFVEGEAILLLLDQLGVCASSGSACTSGSLEPSHVLRAMGVPFTFAHGSVRFSLSRYNTEAEIDFVVREMPKVIERLRSISPFTEGDHEMPACTC